MNNNVYAKGSLKREKLEFEAFAAFDQIEFPDSRLGECLPQ
jgi:hypothetical protein